MKRTVAACATLLAAIVLFSAAPSLALPPPHVALRLAQTLPAQSAARTVAPHVPGLASETAAVPAPAPVEPVGTTPSSAATAARSAVPAATGATHALSGGASRTLATGAATALPPNGSGAARALAPNGTGAATALPPNGSGAATATPPNGSSAEGAVPPGGGRSAAAEAGQAAMHAAERGLGVADHAIGHGTPPAPAGQPAAGGSPPAGPHFVPAQGGAEALARTEALKGAHGRPHAGAAPEPAGGSEASSGARAQAREHLPTGSQTPVHTGLLAAATAREAQAGAPRDLLGAAGSGAHRTHRLAPAIAAAPGRAPGALAWKLATWLMSGAAPHDRALLAEQLPAVGERDPYVDARDAIGSSSDARANDDPTGPAHGPAPSTGAPGSAAAPFGPANPLVVVVAGLLLLFAPFALRRLCVASARWLDAPFGLIPEHPD